MSQHAKLSYQLAEFISGLHYENLPANTLELARLCFLDFIGSCALGSQQAPAQIAISTLRELGGAPQATLLATGEKTSCANAALGNGVAAHIMELDDVHRGSILHAGASVIPAALAAAELRHSNGRQLLEAIVAGYEVAIRIGEAVTPSHYYFWHTTGTCGTFGAAAAAGKLLGLNLDQLVWALGTAGTQAAGLWEFLADGAMSKHLHPAKAAQNGLMAALLAARGFTGATRILEGERGFCRATAPEFELSVIGNGLGSPPYRIDGNSFKIHSCCRHTHPTLDLALELANRHRIKLQDVASVTIKTYGTALDITANYEPATVYAAKFSLPFCAALALKTGHCGPQDFAAEQISDPEIRRLMSRTTLSRDPDLDALHPERWPAVVEITLHSGERYEGRIDYPRGDPENPVGSEELLAKFRSMATPPWGAERVGELAQTIMGLDRVEDVSLIF